MRTLGRVDLYQVRTRPVKNNRLNLQWLPKQTICFGKGAGGSDGHVKRDFIYCNCEKKDGFIEAFNGKLFVFLPFHV